MGIQVGSTNLNKMLMKLVLLLTVVCCAYAEQQSNIDLCQDCKETIEKVQDVVKEKLECFIKLFLTPCKWFIFFQDECFDEMAKLAERAYKCIEELDGPEFCKKIHLCPQDGNRILI